jgi:hypothetical protein
MEKNAEAYLLSRVEKLEEEVKQLTSENLRLRMIHNTEEMGDAELGISAERIDQ